MIINKIYAHTYHMSAYTYTACVCRVYIYIYMYNYIVLYHIILYDIYIYIYMYVITLVCRGLPNVPFLFILNMSFNQLFEIISSNTHMLRARAHTHTFYIYIYIYICRTPPKDIRVYSFFTVVGFYGSIFWWVPMYIYIYLKYIIYIYILYIYLSAIFVAAPGNLKIGGFRVLFQNRWGLWLDHQARLSWAQGIDEFRLV